MKTLVSALLLGFALAGCTGSSLSGDEPLTNRYWRVLEIDGQPVRVEDNRPEPHIVLGPEHKAHGSDGCNRFNGSYDDAKGLHIGPLAATRMACLPPVMNQAQQFMQATAATVDYRIRGKTLELLDAGGRVRMRLEVTFLR